MALSDYLRTAGKITGYLNPMNAATTYLLDRNDVYSKVADPNYDLIPGVSNPFNNQPAGSAAPQPQGASTSQYADETGVLGANTSTSSGGGGGSTATASANTAYLDEQMGMLRDMLSRTGTTLDQGLTQLGDDYNKNVSETNQKRSRALEDFGVQREDTQRGKQGALDSVDTNARTLNNSLRRIIGMASGSGSSAYQLAAPRAVSNIASGQRENVMGTYGRNFRDLDTAESRAKTDFEQLLEDLQAQRQTKERGLREGVLGQEQEINASLADLARKRAVAAGGGYGDIRAAGAPYQANITDRQNKLDALFNQFRTPYNVKEVNVQKPELSKYTTDRAAIQQNQQRGTDPTAPYGQFLRPEEEDERLV